MLFRTNKFYKIFNEKMKNYILSENNFPLILFGPSGCGKTAILAKLTNQVFFFKDSNIKSNIRSSTFLTF